MKIEKINEVQLYIAEDLERFSNIKNKIPEDCDVIIVCLERFWSLKVFFGIYSGWEVLYRFADSGKIKRLGIFSEFVIAEDFAIALQSSIKVQEYRELKSLVTYRYTQEVWDASMKFLKDKVKKSRIIWLSYKEGEMKDVLDELSICLKHSYNIEASYNDLINIYYLYRNIFLEIDNDSVVLERFMEEYYYNKKYD